MTSSHIQLLTQSTVFQSRPPAIQSLILELVEVLSSHPRGLSLPTLFHLVRSEGHHEPEWLGRELGRTLESCGVFRFNPERRFQLNSPELLELPLTELPTVVIDLEATGGRPPLHRLIEVALVRREPDGRETSYVSLANPKRPLPWFISKMTGLTARQVREAPPIDRVMDDLLPYLNGALLVFHGSGLDTELLNYEVHRRTGTLLDNPILCTIALTRELEPDLTTMGLDRVAAHLGIPVGSQHRAWNDTVMTLALYDRYQERFAAKRFRLGVDAAFFQGKLPIPPFLRTNLSCDLIQGLPQNRGAFVLYDEHHRVLVATGSTNLRQELSGLFFPEQSLDPTSKAIQRSARFLEYREETPSLTVDQALSEIMGSSDRRGRRGSRSRGAREIHLT